MAFIHNSTTVLAQSAPLNSTLSTAFNVVSKGLTSRAGINLQRKTFCVCLHILHKHFICLWASKFPVESNGSMVQFKRTVEETAEGCLTGEYLHTLSQTLGTTQINTNTHKYPHAPTACVKCLKQL